MTPNRYLKIKQYLKVADNRNLVEGSEIAKIKPIYDAIYGVHAVMTGNHIILIFIVESLKILEISLV